jgi:quinol-cytochrome oxidoreductase complex cytochrome b subunit
VLHVFVLPLFTIALVAIHLWRVRKDGGLAAIEPLRRERTAEPREASPTKSYSLFGLTPGTSLQVESSTALEEADTTFAAPDLARRIGLVFLAVFNVTLVLALLFEAPLEEAANPIVTPNPAKAPWYFLWLQELVAGTTIRAFGFTISGGLIGGILVPAALLVLLAVWPFLDRTAPSGEGVWFARTRRRQNLVFAVVMLMIVALIAVGVFMRGPSWRLYWPWQSWPPAPKSL